MLSFLGKIFTRTKQVFAASSDAIKGLCARFRGKNKIGETELKEIENSLYKSDFPLSLVDKIMKELRGFFDKEIDIENRLYQVLKDNLKAKSAVLNPKDCKIILLIGSNGSGKTTFISTV